MNHSNQPTHKVLFVATGLRPGGAEKCMVNLACGIDRSRFQPLVVSLQSSPPGRETRLCEQLDQNKIPTYFLNCDSKFQFYRGVKKLRNIIHEQEVSIVQSFLFHANVVAGIALRNQNHVRFFSGIRVADPSWIRHKIEKLATQNAERIICVSENIRQYASEKMRLADEKLIAICNSVDTPSLNPDFNIGKFGISSPFVAFVGRLEKQKGLVPLMNFIKSRTASLPDFDLVFVGEGPQQSALQNIASQLDRKVHFVGWVDQPQDFIAQAEMVMLPSLWEGMPNVILETMAIGKPFLAFAVDGVSELVGDQTQIDASQVIKPGNYKLFLERMSRLITNKRLATEMGQQNQAAVQARFSTKKMIAKYERVYLGDSTSPT